MNIYISTPIATFTEYYSWFGITMDTRRLAGLDLLDQVGELVDPTDEVATASLYQEWRIKHSDQLFRQSNEALVDKATSGAIAAAASDLAAGYIKVVRKFQVELSVLVKELGYKHGFVIDLGGSSKLDSRLTIDSTNHILILTSPLTIASGRIPLELGAAKAVRKPVTFLVSSEDITGDLMRAFQDENVLGIPDLRNAASDIAKLLNGGASEKSG